MFPVVAAWWTPVLPPTLSIAWGLAYGSRIEAYVSMYANTGAVPELEYYCIWGICGSLGGEETPALLVLHQGRLLLAQGKQSFVQGDRNP